MALGFATILPAIASILTQIALVSTGVLHVRSSLSLVGPQLLGVLLDGAGVTRSGILTPVPLVLPDFARVAMHLSLVQAHLAPVTSDVPGVFRNIALRNISLGKIALRGRRRDREPEPKCNRAPQPDTSIHVRLLVGDVWALACWRCARARRHSSTLGQALSLVSLDVAEGVARCLRL